MDSVLRVDLDRGVMIATLVPPITHSERTFMVAGPSSVLLRPREDVKGYLVSDDYGPVQLPGLLSQGSAWAYPGPTPGHAWIPRITNGGPPDALYLVDFGGASAGSTVALENLHPWGPDGTGQVVLAGVGGAYVTGLNGLTRVTPGEVLAAGPTKWLVRECDDRHICKIATIDRRTGHKAPLNIDGLADDLGPVTGVIAPDGSSAAILRQSGALQEIDLSSGKHLDLRASVKPDPVWTLDSRALFYVNDNDGVSFLVAKTGGIGQLASINHADALAVRPAP